MEGTEQAGNGKRVWKEVEMSLSRREEGGRCKVVEEGKASFPHDGEGRCKSQVLK